MNKIILYTFLLFSFLSSQSAKYYSDTFANVVKKVNAAVVTINSEKIVSNERRNPFEEFFYEDFVSDLIFSKGDLVIIASYCVLSENDAKAFKPTVVHVDNQNNVIS